MVDNIFTLMYLLFDSALSSAGYLPVRRRPW